MSVRPRAPRPAEVRDEVMDAAYAFGWTVVRKMPERAARAAFAALADRTWQRHGPGVRQLERNLCRVLGKDAVDDEVRVLSKKVLRSYFRYWLEVFRLPEYDRDRIVGRMRITGQEKIFANLGSGRGVVLALPHMGNYEHAGAWLVHQGHPFTTVAERLKPESLFDRFVAFRESLGMEVLAHKGASAYGRMAQRLRAGRRGLPGRRPGSHRQRGRRGVLRRDRADAGGVRRAGGPDRRRAHPGDPLV